MPRDTDASPRRDAHATIRLRTDRFELMTRIVGATTEQARANLLGVDRKTIYRASRQGVLGLPFVAQTIVALGRHRELLAECGMSVTMDDLFEVVEGSDVDGAEVAA